MNARITFDNINEAAVHRLARFVALVIKPGDLIALVGELGAGKTSFARALVRAFLDDEEHDVPSPSFALVQTYEARRFPLSHFDFYRLSGADELDELGLDEALQHGAALIEWPERAAGRLPQDRLEVAIEDAGELGTRNLEFRPHGSWELRLARLEALMAFVERSPWAGAQPVFLQGDASSRAYARLHKDGATAVLMDSPARPDGAPIRDGKPYSQLVHLAEDVRPFVAVAGALSEAGLTVPDIIAHDLEQGFLITSDLGSRVYDAEAGEDPDLETLYAAAVDVLVHLKAHQPAERIPLPSGPDHTVPNFDLGAFLFEAELLLDWFYEAVSGAPPGDETRQAFLAIFTRSHSLIEDKETAWVLRDYHSPNLLWIENQTGFARVGVIDFQDATCGHAAYDLVSLLQDARRDIAADLEARLFDYYCDMRTQADSAFDVQAFAAAYAVLGAQRSSKILGIFARLAKRDGKHGYLAHIPRVSAYLERNLAHPALDDLRGWFAEHLPVELRERDLEI